MKTKRTKEKNSEYNKRYREKHRSKKSAQWAAYHKTYRLKNKEQLQISGKINQRNKTLRKYGLTVEQYDAMLIAQNGICAICYCPPSKNFALCVDHDHACCPGDKSCGKCIRGLIHNHCNMILGFCREEASVLGGAIQYLARWGK